eukprot:gene2697-3346_t
MNTKRVGIKIENWEICKLPERETINGKYVNLEPLDLSVSNKLYKVFFESKEKDEDLLTYLPWDPINNRNDWFEILKEVQEKEFAFTVCDRQNGDPVGLVSLSSAIPEHGNIEIAVLFSPQMQRTPLSTETVYLLCQLAIDKLEYRRLEWRCHSENERSKISAQGYGFVFEGTIRNHMVLKGGNELEKFNRDTSIFSITKEEWPLCRISFQKWLHPSNFDNNGFQLISLKNIRSAIQRKVKS